MNYILLYILFLILLVIISILIVTKSYSQKSVNQKIIAVSATHAVVGHTAPTEIKNNNSSLSKVAIIKAEDALTKALIVAKPSAKTLNLAKSLNLVLAKTLDETKFKDLDSSKVLADEFKSLVEATEALNSSAEDISKEAMLLKVNTMINANIKYLANVMQSKLKNKDDEQILIELSEKNKKLSQIKNIFENKLKSNDPGVDEKNYSSLKDTYNNIIIVDRNFKSLIKTLSFANKK